MSRRYVPSTLPRLAAGWDAPGPDVADAVLATDDGDETEYAALMTGYNNLLILAGALYLVAFVLTPAADRQRRLVRL